MALTAARLKHEPKEGATGRGCGVHRFGRSIRNRPSVVVPSIAVGDGSASHRGLATALARYRAFAVALAASDAACLISSLLLLHWVGAAGELSQQQLLFLFSAGPLAWVTVFASFGLYRVQRIPGWNHFREVSIATTLASSVLVLMFLDGRSDLRLSFALTWSCTLLLELVTRRLWRTRVKRLRQGGPWTLRTLVVGTNHEADELAHSLLAPGSGFEPLGYVAAGGGIGNANTLPVLATVDDLTTAVREHAAECLFVASSDVNATDMAIVSRVARQEQLEVRFAANLPEVLPSRVAVEVSNGVVALTVTPVRLTPGKAAVKRMFDLGVGAFLLVAAAPVMAVVALAVRLSSRGPVFFRQDRVTKGGRIFSIFKFRTMVVDEEQPPGLDLDPTRTFFKMRDDPRLTNVGRFLRRYSLDELPQLWNVIRGDLSLVGPRPLWTLQVDATAEMFQHRHEVAAGVTGWWQVNGRSSVDADEALRMDSFYIENWSLWLDVCILVRTVPAVLTRHAAY